MSAAAEWQHWPQSWYVVARADAVPAGRVISGHLGGHAWVLYRGQDGVLRASDAFCPHMGAHLRTATVAGDTLVCALHACHIHPQTSPPPKPEHAGCHLSARAWPCAEQFGLIWLHPPADKTAPLPFADAADSAHWLNGGPQTIAADWRAMICNGFDLAHMRAVHQREVVGKPVFERLPEGGLRMTYTTRVLAKGGWSSWLMKRLSGGHIHLVHTCIGSSILVHSRVGKMQTLGLFALLPQDAPGTAPETRRTLAFAAVGLPRGTRGYRIKLYLVRALYLAFLRKDFVVVEGMRLQLAHIDDPGVQAVADYQGCLKAMEPPP
ncbi:nitrite reductase/ring-hydroxylating ferredoxin subunit [Neisseria sp. HSC-16F19]|nr:Rieske 2Fe-2S domain-containing protein [Neisseria sp. HSC-16F19]MCP2039973.1 nitrite reductase/ring-hydroxylating ferredoxin subunit [Neisseria sp. HSC-16F19]